MKVVTKEVIQASHQVILPPPNFDTDALSSESKGELKLKSRPEAV